MLTPIEWLAERRLAAGRSARPLREGVAWASRACLSSLGKAEIERLGDLTRNQMDDINVSCLLALLGIENVAGCNSTGTFFAIDPAERMRIYKLVLPSGHNAVLFSPNFMESLRTICCFVPGIIYRLQTGQAGVSPLTEMAFLSYIGRFWLPDLPVLTPDSMLLHALPEQLWPNVQHLFFASWASLLGHELSHAENGDIYGDKVSNMAIETRADQDGLDMFSRYIRRNYVEFKTIVKHVCVAPYLTLCLLAMKDDLEQIGDRHPSISKRLEVLNDRMEPSLRSELGTQFNEILGPRALDEIRLVGAGLVEWFSEKKKTLDDLARKTFNYTEAFPRLHEVEGQAPEASLRLAIGEAQLATLTKEQRSHFEALFRQYAAAVQAEAQQVR